MRQLWTGLILGALLLTGCSPDPVPTPSRDAAPVVSLRANPESGTAPLTVSFIANASDENGDELSYSWSFGDGTVKEGGATTTHVYDAPGTYEAVVSVTDNNGPPVTAARSITVVSEQSDEPPGTPDPPAEEPNAEPHVTLAAEPVSGPAPLTTILRAAASDPDGDELNYTWNLGNGTGDFQGGVQVTAEYTTPGTYTATVTVTDDHGGTASDAIRLFVQEAAAAQELLIYGADPSSNYTTFLGCLNCPASDPESVHNEYGSYGSEYSSTSIFNDYGTYGSPYSNKSACNQYGQSPPIVVDETSTYYGQLTLNQTLPDAIRDPEIVEWLQTVVCP